ncbi:hypothetical protein GIB67_037738 [Kingdonia uniflora]|uniref:Pentatricopeptide repeat-containing protein n=1 Tax=Kingdonia uniflora TaxID=39325 RepID=A0A7J7LV55_9MAGN|nr:hypothetical protein GIB67_037738 [Kingdonia uniflora]
MISTALHHTNLFLTKFIHKCFDLGFSDYAFSVFSHKTQPDIHLYNTIIKAFSQTDTPIEAVVLFNKIQQIGLRPDSYSFPFVLKGIVRLCRIELGVMIHAQAVRVGLDSDVHVVTALIQMYSSCGVVVDARKLFNRMFLRDVVLWNAMVAGYAKMNRPNEAIGLFRRMQVEDIEPDEVSMLAVLSACAHLGALDLGEWVHDYIEKCGMNKKVSLMNALIDMYAKSGKIDKAFEVFEMMDIRSVVTWTTMIAGLALHGLGREALEMFARMENSRVKPNAVTFLAILSACSHVGLVEMGRWYFSKMSSRYKTTPKIEHYGCMVDLLGRAGYLQEAQDLVRGMPFEPNGAIWGSLLAASRVHGDVELGECALKHLVELEPCSSGNYLTLSNMYAASGKWYEAGMVRKAMRDKCIKKMLGGSCIEVNNIVHEFISGDKSHPQFKSIYAVLNWVSIDVWFCSKRTSLAYEEG